MLGSKESDEDDEPSSNGANVMAKYVGSGGGVTLGCAVTQVWFEFATEVPHTELKGESKGLTRYCAAEKG